MPVTTSTTHFGNLSRLARVPNRRPERIGAQRPLSNSGATCPPLDRVRSLATEFARLLKAHDSSALDPWLGAAEQSALRGFATSLRRDRDAVLAAVLFQWSNGQIEGQVQRLKLIKRTMYGQASFELLRRCVGDAA